MKEFDINKVAIAFDFRSADEHSVLITYFDGEKAYILKHITQDEGVILLSQIKELWEYVVVKEGWRNDRK